MQRRLLLIIAVIAVFAVLGILIRPVNSHSQPRTPMGLESVEQGFVEIAKKVEPTLVNISAEKTERVRVPSPFEEFMQDPFFRRFFRDFPFPEEQTFRRSTLGSGFIVDARGYIVTNAHVVEGFDEVTVTTYHGKVYKGKVVGRDDRDDIALVKIEPREPLQPAILGDSDHLEVGQLVAAFGNPFGVGQSMSVGIISAKGRRQTVEEKAYFNLIQTDAALNPGNSGGPLVNIKGEVIGVNVAIASPVPANAGVGFAIPINIVKKVLPQLKEGKVARGYLGVEIEDVSPDMKEVYGADKGALVVRVRPGSPAERADIREGDIIVRFNGREINNTADLIENVAFSRPGTVVTLTLIRDKRQIEKRVTLGSYEEEQATAPSTPAQEREIVVENLTPQLKQRYNLPADARGVVVTSVKEDSAFSKAGIREGDVVFRVDNTPIHTVGEFQEAIKKAQKRGFGFVWVRRGNATMVVNVYF